MAGHPDPIPVHRPLLGAPEREALLAQFDRGVIDGDGATGQRVEARLEALTGSPHVLLVNSATAALELALELIDLGPGDEALCPSWTFPSTANAVLRTGARPVFVDVLPGSLTLDPDDVARALTPATRVVLPVDYAGIGNDVAALRAVCGPDVAVVSDTAHGLGATRDGRPLGTDGEAAALSFHASKNLVCGEGGALLLRDDAHAARAERLREKGTSRAAFLRGEVDHYEWVDVGTSGTLSDLLAALLEAQLERLDAVTAERRRLAARYDEAFADLAGSGALRLLEVPAGCAPNGHLYAVRTRDRAARDRLAAGLAERGISAPIHFVPLHGTAFARQRLGDQRPLPVTEDAGETLLRLPLFAGLTDDQQQRVVEGVRALVG